LVETHVLPAQEREPEEAPELFAERVQKQIAEAINLQPTTYSVANKNALRQDLFGKKSK